MQSSLIGVLQKIWQMDQLVKIGEFKLTAAQLSVTPSALTQSMKALEAHFDRTLIIRSKGQVLATSDGENILEKFSPLLQNLEQLNAEMKADTGPKKLRLGAYDSLAIRYLPELYSKILEINPQLKIDLRVGRSSELSTYIRQGHMDMAIIIDAQESDSYYSTTIAYNCFSIYTHKNNLSEGKIVENIGMGCLRADSDGRQSFLSKALQLLQLKSKDFRVQSDSFEALLALCRSGSITALLPVDLASEYLDELVEVNDLFHAEDIQNMTRHPISVISRKSFPEQWRLGIEEGLKSLKF